MEWFWRLIDRFQKSVAGTALQSFSTTDWVLLIVIFWGLVQGSRRGFSDMFGKLLGIFLVSMLTLSFYPSGAAYLVANLPMLPLKVAESLVFFLMSVFLWISVSWCINLFGQFFKVEAQGILKTLGGMVLGVLRMVLLISFFVQFLLFLPIEPMQKIFKPGRTYAGYTVSRVVPDLHKFIVSSLHKPVSRKIAESVKVGG
jgi:uncharacterized membrane protein required for colicin V production